MNVSRLFPVFMAAAALPAGGQQMSDFHKPDVNTTSLRRRATAAEVSPRDYLHQVSAWYFGAEN